MISLQRSMHSSADIDPWTRNELLDLFLALSAERAFQQVATIADSCHRVSFLRGRVARSAGRRLHAPLPLNATCAALSAVVPEPMSRVDACGQLSVPYAGTLVLRLPSTWSTSPYSTAWSAVRILSRSMSLRTRSTGCLECRAMVSSSQVRIRSTSLAWISISEA